MAMGNDVNITHRRWLADTDTDDSGTGIPVNGVLTINQ